MSLTTFVKEKDVSDRFQVAFKRPQLETTFGLRVPPRSKRYSLVGTAFDYLLRFYTRRINPFAVERKWIAEGALTSPFSPILDDVVLDPYTDKTMYKETRQTRKVKEIIDTAKKEHDKYIRSGQLTNALFRSVLCLAQIDPMMRTDYVDPNLGLAQKEDIEDLEELISIVDPKCFKARDICLLNPQFGEASALVGGADADILLDDTLIDIKVTSKLELRSETLHQLLGYITLNAIDTIGDMKPRPSIERAGVYFARHGYLFTFKLIDLIGQTEFRSFVDWFRERARRKSPEGSQRR